VQSARDLVRQPPHHLVVPRRADRPHEPGPPLPQTPHPRPRQRPRRHHPRLPRHLAPVTTTPHSPTTPAGPTTTPRGTFASLRTMVVDRPQLASRAFRASGPHLRWRRLAYLSTSPTTKKVDPRIATMSPISAPGNSSESTW